jgi:hypothetical protein
MDLLRPFLRTTRSAGSSSGIRSFIDKKRVLIIFVQVDHSAGEFVGEVVNYDTYTREIIFPRTASGWPSSDCIFARQAGKCIEASESAPGTAVTLVFKLELLAALPDVKVGCLLFRREYQLQNYFRSCPLNINMRSSWSVFSRSLFVFMSGFPFAGNLSGPSTTIR